jgi:hypothetical protein
MSPFVNICVTQSRSMHLSFTCEVHGSRIVQHILDNLRMENVLLICDFDSATMLFPSLPVSDV